MMFTFTFVVFLAVAALALGQNDCPAKAFRGVDCCDTTSVQEPFNKEKVSRCMKKNFRNNPPRTSSEMRNARVCAKECIMSEEGLLTADLKLDKAAITKFFSPYETIYGPAYYSVLDKCFDSYEADVDASQECKSGSHEFYRCALRTAFLECPSSVWSATSECEELKANVTRCLNTPVMMRVGKAH